MKNLMTDCKQRKFSRNAHILKQLTSVLFFCLIFAPFPLTADSGDAPRSSEKSQSNIIFGADFGIALSFAYGGTYDWHFGMDIQREEFWAEGVSVGLFGGVFGIIPISDRFFFRSGIGLNLFQEYQMGYYKRQNNVPMYLYPAADFSKIEIPLLIGYDILDDGRLNVYFGPGLGLYLWDSYWKDELGSFGLSLDAVVSYHITESWYAEVKIKVGISNLYAGDGRYLLDLAPEDFNQSGIILGAAYTF